MDGVADELLISATSHMSGISSRCFFSDDIIASKESSGRAKDLESLPRLKSFRLYWLEQSRR